jgi:phage gpG-like protein
MITYNLKEINALAQKLNSFALSSGDAEKLLHSLGVEVKEQTLDRFDEERDPDGNKWRALTEKYAKRKIKKSRGGILVREGKLSAIAFRVNGWSVLTGSPMNYADYHQNAKKAKRRRRFLGLSAGNISDLSNMIDAFMKGKAHG